MRKQLQSWRAKSMVSYVQFVEWSDLFLTFKQLGKAVTSRMMADKPGRPEDTDRDHR